MKYYFLLIKNAGVWDFKGGLIPYRKYLIALIALIKIANTRCNFIRKHFITYSTVVLRRAEKELQGQHQGGEGGGGQLLFFFFYNIHVLQGKMAMSWLNHGLCQIFYTRFTRHQFSVHIFSVLTTLWLVLWARNLSSSFSWYLRRSFSHFSFNTSWLNFYDRESLPDVWNLRFLNVSRKIQRRISQSV